MIIDLANIQPSTWICNACEVRWTARLEAPCWSCGSAAAVAQHQPKPLGDSSLVDPVAPPW